VGVGERDQRRDGPGLGDPVRVGREHVLALGRGDSEVHVRREAERLWVLEGTDPLRHRVDRSRHVRDDDGLVDLGYERGK
jgi:hypothetical protein